LYKTLDSMFKYLSINKWIEVHLNNRKFIDSICDYFSIKDTSIKDFYKLLDDFYKITKSEFNNRLKIIVWEKKSVEILKILETDITDLVFDDKKISDSITEIKKVFNLLKNNWVNVKFDPYITRWLDYYTWTVFETFITDYTWFWSICSGWRFDNLVWDIRNTTWIKWKNYWWVWGSIGITRLFNRLLDSWLINKKAALVDIIIFNVPGISDGYRKQVANLLRDSWINTDIYYKQDKLWKQFSYAENKNIPFWIFAWKKEEEENKVILKDLDTRESYKINIDDLVIEIKEKLSLIIK
jgi:histidyl-tRNA synthetase